jgi:hypothetical protein
VSAPHGQLERSLAALTIGVHQAAEQRRRTLADTITGEYEQQVHVPLAGEAAAGWAFVDSAVRWEMPFLYAPLQRRVPFPAPHFGYGIEHVSGQSALVVIHAAVAGWTITDEQWYVGATVRFAVHAPAADPASPGTPYAAVAHLSFQGYATMAETDEFAT